MKTALAVLVPLLALGAALYGQDLGGANVNVNNQVTSNQNTNVTATGTNSQSSAEGGKSSVNVNAFSNVEGRTAPLTTFPPYLPYWTHGGWGTIKAYFPNGPTLNDGVYETTFDPKNDQDMRELRNVLTSLPHRGPLEVLGSVLNGVGTVLGGPDMYHHGRGFQIADSIARERRPERKPLLVFIDSNVDPQLLAEEGYAYVGKVSVEGDVERNWDHVYMATVAEALPWDVDILLVSGGMKGVTVGSNLTFPSGAAGYSQSNYSLSLFGAAATGITEGKGKAVVSGEAYRFAPLAVERRRIPEALYDRIRSRFAPVPPEGTLNGRPPWQEPSAMSIEPNEEPGAEAVPQPRPQGTGQGEQLLPPLEPNQPVRTEPPALTPCPPALVPPCPIVAEPAREPDQPAPSEFNLPVVLEPAQPVQKESCVPGFRPLAVPAQPLVVEPQREPNQPRPQEPVTPAPCPTRVPLRPLAAEPCGALQVQHEAAALTPRPAHVQARAFAAEPPCGSLPQSRTSARRAGYARPKPPAPKVEPGIEISRELFNMAGFPDASKIKHLTVR